MTAEKIKDAASDAKDTVVEAGRDLLAQAKTRVADAASGAGAALRDGAEARAEAGRDMLADEGHRLAQSLRDAAADQGDGTLQGRLLDTVAGSVANVAEGLRGRSLQSMLAQTESFARRNPGAFVAGAALAGFALARFARASAPAAPSPASGNESPAVKTIPARTRTAGNTTAGNTAGNTAGVPS